MNIPTYASSIIEALENAGFEACVVGGYVRDSLLGRVGEDVDIATSAYVSEVHAVFEDDPEVRVFDTGIRHGTVTVVHGGALPVEVTTYRIDGPYEDGRHPREVRFTRSLEDDLARRDFTINAMAYRPGAGIIDPYGGLHDLDLGLIHCVGEPRERFSEDGLRVLRALRFASQLGFKIGDATSAAVIDCIPMLGKVSRERIGVEFTKLICGMDARRVLDGYRDVVAAIIPQLESEMGLEQRNDHHIFDVWGHSIRALENVPASPVYRYAALLHDIGKTVTRVENPDGTTSFPGHEAAGVGIARSVCRDLRLPTEWTRRICTIIGHHGDGLRPERENLLRAMGALGPDMVRDVLVMKRADMLALHPRFHEAVAIFDEVEESLARLETGGACYSRDQLTIKGADLLALGVPQGPTVGKLLDWLLEEVISGRLPNERDALLSQVRACVDANPSRA